MMEDLSALIQRTFETQSNGLSEKEMRHRGYRLISAAEYLKELEENETMHKTKLISLWKPVKCNPDVDSGMHVAFAASVSKYVDSKGMLAHATIETAAFDDDATVYSATETIGWSGGHINSVAEGKEDDDDDEGKESTYVANEGISSANDAKTLWGDLLFK